MSSIALKSRVVLMAVIALVFSTLVGAQTLSTPRRQNEVMVLRALSTLHSAQATFQATEGNGNYGSLQNLYQMGFIDEALASGTKYGYTFVVTFAPYSPPSTPATFSITATPRIYRKTGLRSFYIAGDGLLRGGDKQGAPADGNDPEIDEDFLCSGNEQCAISRLKTLHGAQATYQATFGNGNFGSLEQLRSAGLITQAQASGTANGYSYTVTIVDQTQKVPASFRISAVPQIYGTSGIRSFFIATDGVLRCADRNGEPADENDPQCSQ